MSANHETQLPASEGPMREISRQSSVFSIQTLLFVVFLMVAPQLVSSYWLSAIILPVLILALAGIGLNIKTGYSGMVSLGSGAFMAVGAYAMFNVAVHGGVTQYFFALLLGGFVAAITGYAFSLPTSRIRGFYVMVTTLAAQFFFEWLFTKVAFFYNYGSVPTIALPPMHLFGLDINGSDTVRYYFAVAVVLSLTWIAHNIIQSHVGRNMTAVRDMNTAAGVIGIDAAKSKRISFTIGSFYLGIAGALWAFLFLGTASTLSFDINRSFQILFIVIIGGMSSIRGNFIGAAFILMLPIFIYFVVKTMLSGALDPGLLSNLNKVIFGSLIIVLLMKEPEGFDRMLRNISSRIMGKG